VAEANQESSVPCGRLDFKCLCDSKASMDQIAGWLAGVGVYVDADKPCVFAGGSTAICVCDSVTITFPDGSYSGYVLGFDPSGKIMYFYGVRGLRRVNPSSFYVIRLTGVRSVKFFSMSDYHFEWASKVLEGYTSKG